MAAIPISYLERHTPLVSGGIILHGQHLLGTLNFLVDSAAESSLIAPADEAVLLSRNQTCGIQGMFLRGVKPIKTVLGNAHVKYLPGRKQGITGIFLLDHRLQPVSKPVDYLYFVDEDRPIVPRKARKGLCRWLCGDFTDHLLALPCEDLPYSILGRDVLNQYAMVSIPGREYGFLTDDPDHLTGLIGGTGSPFVDIDRYLTDPPDLFA